MKNIRLRIYDFENNLILEVYGQDDFSFTYPNTLLKLGRIEIKELTAMESMEQFGMDRACYAV